MSLILFVAERRCILHLVFKVKVKVCFIVNSATCTIHTYRELKLRYSEFSGAWGKRGEGGQGREGVQLPDSLMDEAVFQSVGPGLETPQSPP